MVFTEQNMKLEYVTIVFVLAQQKRKHGVEWEHLER